VSNQHNAVKLTKQQRDAVEVLAEARSVREAALRLAVSERVVLQWLEDPHFQAAVEANLERTYQSALRLMKAKAVRAAATLAEEMESSKPNKDRILAADKLLTQTLRYIENLEFRSEIADLRSKVKSDDGPEGEAERPAAGDGAEGE